MGFAIAADLSACKLVQSRLVHARTAVAEQCRALYYSQRGPWSYQLLLRLLISNINAEINLLKSSVLLLKSTQLDAWKKRLWLSKESHLHLSTKSSLLSCSFST